MEPAQTRIERRLGPRAVDVGNLTIGRRAHAASFDLVTDILLKPCSGHDHAAAAVYFLASAMNARN